MAFDACMMRAVLSEITREFPDAKIEKVLQPQNDEIDMVIHSGKRSRRLCFNVGPNAPRLQLTDAVKENPLKAPMFCMLMRKLFIGGRIVRAEQIGFDRIAELTVSCYDEMGFLTERKIICEIMGKYANLIVTDKDYKIISALKMIDFSASTVRQVLPGLKYEIPAKQDKLSPLVIDRAMFFEKLAGFPKERTLEKFITGVYSGIATQIAHELTYRVSRRIDTPIFEVDTERFYSVFEEWQRLLINEDYTPTVAVDTEGKPKDYSYMNISYLCSGEIIKSFPTLAELFDFYFAEKDRLEKLNQRAKDLFTLLSNAEARTSRKLAIQREALIDSEKGEEYKKYGDLITANLYRLQRGMRSFTATDYYDEACPEITVPLDERLHPSQNAQRMYKLYNKCKTAKVILTEQIATWEAELVYLDSVRSFLSKAETEADLAEIREELYRSGYASRMKNYKSPKQIKVSPMEFVTSGGYHIFVGRNNMQNEHLTFRVAEKSDLWFHVKDVPGSHVIMVTGGEEPGEKDYTEAAGIAAYYSQAKGDLVAVDYTQVKNVKKVQGAKPGFVIYKTNYTAFVKPISSIEKGEVNNG